jgi:hypothetical protein
MIPKITNGGSSFKGAFQYYMHDKCADTSDRIAWVHTENMRTSDPAKAWKVMAYTAQAQERLKEASGQSRAGRKLEKPVFAFSLAWHPEQSPSQEHMLETARKAIATLGLNDHETVIVSHQDEPQKHVHVIVNRVHPITGLAGDVRNSKRKLSDFALEYERIDGKIYCEEREENHKKREKGEKTVYSDRHIVEAWETTDSGKAFAAALQKHDCTLARGDKRIVIVDPYGKAHNPARLLKNVKAKDIRARLSDIDLSKLPCADAIASKTKSTDREKKARQEAFETAAKHQKEALQDKHEREFVAMQAQQTRRVAHTKKHLAEYYGLPKRKSSLVALRDKIKSASVWARLFGTTRKDRKTMREQALVYNKAVKCYRGRIAKISEHNEKSVVELRSKQEDERRKLEFQIEMQRETGMDMAHLQERTNERPTGRLSKIFAAAQNPDLAKKDEDGRLKQPSKTYRYRNL